MSSAKKEVNYKELPSAGQSRWPPCISRLFCNFRCSPPKVLFIVVATALVTCLIIYSCLDRKLLDRLCCSTHEPGQTPPDPESAIHQSSRVTGERDHNYKRKNGGGREENVRYKHTKRRLPQCLIIGVRKGGTRALLNFVNLHPAIQVANKEVHFFDDDDNYSLGLDWYVKKMPYSFEDQITLEKTPAYFVEDYVPERVYKMNSSIKLILIVRDPTERAISDYTQIHWNKIEKGKPHESFEELAIDEETGEVRKSYNAIRRSLYHRAFERWLKYFAREQFLVLGSEALVKNPYPELVKVEKFLNLEHKITAANFYYNRTRGFFCLRNETHEKCLSESKGRKHPDVNPDVIRKLQDFFRPHNLKFYRLVDQDFGWP